MQNWKSLAAGVCLAALMLGSANAESTPPAACYRLWRAGDRRRREGGHCNHTRRRRFVDRRLAGRTAVRPWRFRKIGITSHWCSRMAIRRQIARSKFHRILWRRIRALACCQPPMRKASQSATKRIRQGRPRR